MNVNYITQETLCVVFEQPTEYMTKHYTKVQQQNTTQNCKNIWYSAFIICVRVARKPLSILCDSDVVCGFDENGLYD